jgi:hypothetical protein
MGIFKILAKKSCFEIEGSTSWESLKFWQMSCVLKNYQNSILSHAERVASP